MFVDVWLTIAPLFGALLTRKSWCQATLSSNVLAVHFARELRAIFARELRAIFSGQSSPVNSGNSGHRIGCSLRAIARKDNRRQRETIEKELEELEYIMSSYESDNET